MKYVLLGLFTSLAFAASTVTVTPGPHDLYLGTKKLSTHADESACFAAAKARNVTASYTCRTRTGVAVTVTADPPVCGAKPADESRAQTCPTGTTGTWTQTRTYTSTASPTCWVATPWAPSVAPAQFCTPTTDPPPPPPTGNVITANPPNADMSALKPGDTLMLKPGAYSAIKEKSGTAAAYNTVRAETDGTVTVSGLNTSASFIRYEGLKFIGASTKTVTGDHLKFFRTSFSGGPANGNAVTLQIGTNDKTPGASSILLEDVWVYGPGGRYKVLVYNAQKVVLRRVFTRHDGGWAYDGDNPQGGFALYDSVDVACQDCFYGDSVQSLDGFESALYLVSNSTTTQRQSNVTINGAVIVGSANNGIGAEGTGSAANYTLADVAIIGSKAGGLNTNNSAHVINASRVTCSVTGTCFGKWAKGGAINVTDCKVTKGTLSSGASLSNCPGGGGAKLVYRIGVSGTMFGEPGFEDLTTDPLWPYPNEVRIKADFDAVRPAFGGKSLTQYVQGATQ